MGAAASAPASIRGSPRGGGHSSHRHEHRVSVRASPALSPRLPRQDPRPPVSSDAKPRGSGAAPHRVPYPQSQFAWQPQQSSTRTGRGQHAGDAHESDRRARTQPQSRRGERRDESDRPTSRHAWRERTPKASPSTHAGSDARNSNLQRPFNERHREWRENQGGKGRDRERERERARGWGSGDAEEHDSSWERYAVEGEVDGGEDMAWLEDAMTMELEASEEMLRSCRHQLANEAAERAKAEARLASFEPEMLRKDQEVAALKQEVSRLQREIDSVRADRTEADQLHDEEVTRLRTELRMARRHEEFLAKELEAQRSTSNRRMRELQLESHAEMHALRTEVDALTLRCEELSTGQSIIASSATPRPTPRHESWAGGAELSASRSAQDEAPPHMGGAPYTPFAPHSDAKSAAGTATSNGGTRSALVAAGEAYDSSDESAE